MLSFIVNINISKVHKYYKIINIKLMEYFIFFFSGMFLPKNLDTVIWHIQNFHKFFGKFRFKSDKKICQICINEEQVEVYLLDNLQSFQPNAKALENQKLAWNLEK